MAEATAAYRFFSWLRQGLLAGITNSASALPTVNGHFALPIRLRVNDASDFDVPIELYGPGDVTGLDAREVIRTDPQQAMTDFEPNYFPLIEFDRPDFPWLFTPAKQDAGNRLRPWICLVVVRKDAVTLTTRANQPSSVLECPLQELPNLDQAWAWAHTQIVASNTSIPDPPQHAALKQILAHQPERTLSRLLSPRRLDPNTAYLACLVPTYDIGRKIGLGESVTTAEEQALQPAWNLGAAASEPVKLPVYFHWEFRTGLAGDFESLARRAGSQALADHGRLASPGRERARLGHADTATRYARRFARGWAARCARLIRNLPSGLARHASHSRANCARFSTFLRSIRRLVRLRHCMHLLALTSKIDAVNSPSCAHYIEHMPGIRAEFAAAEKLALGMDRRIARHAAKEAAKTIGARGNSSPTKSGRHGRDTTRA